MSDEPNCGLGTISILGHKNTGHIMTGLNATAPSFEGPSLADAIANLRTGKSSLGEDGKALASQVARLAEILQRTPADLPADWRQVKIILDAEVGEGWRGLDFPTQGAWNTFRSRAKTGIEGAFQDARLDPLKRRGRNALAPAWQAFMAELDAAQIAGTISKWTTFTLTGLARFASAQGADPGAVNPGLFQAWIAAAEVHAKAAGKLVRNARVRGPGRHAYDAARAWNKLIASGVAPGAPVVLRGLRTKRKWNSPISSFHPELRNEIDCYVEWLRGGVAQAARQAGLSEDDPFGAYATGEYEHVRFPDRVNAAGNGPKPRITSVSPGTVKRYLHLIRLTVNAVAEERRIPVSSIRSLADVVNPDGAAKALKVHMHRQKERGKWDPRCSSLHGIGAWILGVARSWSRLDEVQIARIKAMMKDPRVRTESVGRMSAQRRDALRNIHHSWFVKTWVDLPTALVNECRRPDGSYKTDEGSRATMRAAVALAIAQILPLRLENLSTFTISGRSPTLVRPRVRTGFWSVDVPAAEIKNKDGAYGVLDARASAIIAAYVEHIRPIDLRVYAKGHSDCLFPGNSKSEHRSGHIDIKCTGKAISSRLQAAGLGNLTTHCIRHVTATLLLAWRPDLLQTVADLLGDTVETVEKHYVRGNTAAAVKMNLVMIEEHLRASGHALAGFGGKKKPKTRATKAEVRRAA